MSEKVYTVKFYSNPNTLERHRLLTIYYPRNMSLTNVKRNSTKVAQLLSQEVKGIVISDDPVPNDKPYTVVVTEKLGDRWHTYD